MKKVMFMDKYPVYTLELDKKEVEQKRVCDIMEYFKVKIDAHPTATFIAIFDQYSHTKSLNGEINPEIKDVQNIIFCFGNAIPNTRVMAARPRSIGVCEMEDKFIVEFLEAPKEQMHEVMESWAKGLKIKD